MRIPDFRAPTPDDFKTIDPRIFEMLSTTWKVLRDVVRLLQGKLGPDNLNVEVLLKDLKPASAANPGVTNLLELPTLRGAPLGALPLLVDLPGGKVVGFGCQVLDEDKIEVGIRVHNSAGADVTTPVTARILVIGG